MGAVEVVLIDKEKIMELVQKEIIEDGTVLFDGASTKQLEHALSGYIRTVHFNNGTVDAAPGIEHEAEQWLAELLGSLGR
ncbi:hypothetical protein CR51_07450 [Caballeronia megalochromosomata]|nr:hypothetical protein CR51_07450 [Caballeronia megalochromosomata]